MPVHPDNQIAREIVFLKGFRRTANADTVAIDGSLQRTDKRDFQSQCLAKHGLAQHLTQAQGMRGEGNAGQGGSDSSDNRLPTPRPSTDQPRLRLGGGHETAK